MKERNWVNLVTSLKSDRCVLVVGPDLTSAQDNSESNYIEPSVLLSEYLASELEEEDVKVWSDSLIPLTQQYEDASEMGGPTTLRAQTASFYQSRDFVPSELHRALVNLPFSLILTTRHDPIMESMLKEVGKNAVSGRYNMRASQQYNPEQSHRPTVTEPMLFRLFGHTDEPESLILSENDILDFVIAISAGRPSLPIGLMKMLKTKGQSFLFLGFGIKDWYLRVLLKILMRVLDIDRSGFAVASESLHDFSDEDKSTTVLFFQRGNRVEIEDSSPLAFVEELRQRLDKAGGIPTRAVVPGPLIRTFICHAKEDAELAKALQSSLVERGFDAWLDAHELEGGQDWDSEIRAALDTTDFVLVIYSDALYRKTDAYVNKEIHLAIERSQRVRGQYLIPMRTNNLPTDKTIEALARFQEMPLGTDQLNDNVESLVSVLKRAKQRRER